MKNSFFSVLGVLSLASAVVCSASPVWETDWSKALEKAGKSGQPVLVDFTGSDWCPGCIYLRKNIFDTDAFAKYAEDNNFVLLELDKSLKSQPVDDGVLMETALCRLALAGSSR